MHATTNILWLQPTDKIFLEHNPISHGMSQNNGVTVPENPPGPPQRSTNWKVWYVCVSQGAYGNLKRK